MPTFISPPNQSSYYEQVWALTRLIPRGKVIAYGQLAKMIPPPEGVALEAYVAFAPRWVGGAMANCPSDVPWQRVVNAQGKISERPGAQRQRSLLEAEGVIFDAKGKVDLKKFGWNGETEDDVSQQASLF